MDKLLISESFALPADFITQRSTVFGTSGSGKTYMAMKIVEEIQRLKLPCVIIDYVGVWWGLTVGAGSSPEQSSPGLPLIIVGGSEASQLPVTSAKGKQVAQIFKDMRQNMILDVSAWPDLGRCQFISDFLDELYLLHRDRSPLLIVADEAHRYAPQSTGGGKEIKASLDSLTNIATTGRAKGLGLMSLTQRPALINNNVWSQSETLLAGLITYRQDRGKVQEWIAGNAPSEDWAGEAIRTIESIQKKELAICSVMADPIYFSDRDKAQFQVVKVRASQRITYDSSASITVENFSRIDPRPLPPEKLSALLQITNQDDEESSEVAALQQRIDFLQRQLAEKDNQNAPVDLNELNQVLRTIEGMIRDLGRIATSLGQNFSIFLPDFAIDLTKATPEVEEIWKEDRKIDFTADERRAIALIKAVGPVDRSTALRLGGSSFESGLAGLEEKNIVSPAETIFSIQGVDEIAPLGPREILKFGENKAVKGIIELILSGVWSAQVWREADIAKVIQGVRPGSKLRKSLDGLVDRVILSTAGDGYYFLSPLTRRIAAREG